MPHIIIVGTLDTKGEEFMYLRHRIFDISRHIASSTRLTLVDCGTNSVVNDAITIGRSELLEQYGSCDSGDFTAKTRGKELDTVIPCAAKYINDLRQENDIHGIVGAGGSSGTSVISAVMREAVPLGLPKLIVSTISSGDTGPVVGETDITLMYSVVDIAGTNQLLRGILSNAAAAIVGMSVSYERHLSEEGARMLRAVPLPKRTRVGITMFGVTTPCVDAARGYLESRYNVEVFVFHATGHGGKSMERLIREGYLDALLDITTTEVCDLIAGGNWSAGPRRLEAALKTQIPNIISVGATDMVNFGPFETVPECYRHRKLLKHNATVTLMRTSVAEYRKVAAFILDKLIQFTQDTRMVEVWLPVGGVSSVSVPLGPFADADADAELFKALTSGLEGSGVRVVQDARDINDKSFAIDLAERLMRIVKEVQDK